MINFYKNLTRGISLFFFIFIAIHPSFSATYYNRNNPVTGTRSCNTVGDWTTDASGGSVVDGTGGTSPGNFTTAGDIFIIRSGSTMQQSGNWSVGTSSNSVSVIINGTLNNSANITLNGASTLTINGTLNNSAAATLSGTGTFIVENGGVLDNNCAASAFSISTLTVNNGGTFRKSGTGTLTITTATFGAASNTVFNSGADRFDPQFNYGNLTFNATTNPNMGTTYPLRVQGNLTISRGTFTLSTTASLTTHSVGGNITLNNANGAVIFYVGNGSGNPLLTVGGNINLTTSTSNTCSFYVAGPSSTGSPRMITASVVYSNTSTTSTSNFFVSAGTSGSPYCRITGNVDMRVTGAGGNCNFYIASSSNTPSCKIGGDVLMQHSWSATYSCNFYATNSSSGPTDTIAGNVSLTANGGNTNFYVSNGSGGGTLNINGNVTLSSSSSSNAYFYVASSSGSPTLNIGGNVSLSSTWASSYVANFIVSNSSGAPTVNITGNVTLTGTSGPTNFLVTSGTGAASVNITGNVTINGSTFGISSFEVKTSSSTGNVNPSLNIAGTVYLAGTNGADYSIFAVNRSANGVPVVTMGNLNMTMGVFWGSTNTGNSTITVTGDINQSSSTSTNNVVLHVSNRTDGGAAATIGNVTLTVNGSIILGSNGHIDLSYSELGGVNTIYVGGSVTGSGNSIFGGPHGAERTGSAPTLIFKSPSSGTATGTLWLTTGDFDNGGGGLNGASKSPRGIAQFNVQIQANRIITLTSHVELGDNKSFTVDAGGTLITGSAGGTAYVIGRRAGSPAAATGTVFTLSPASGGLYSEIRANATPDALTATAAAGNVQTSTRNYSSSANYRFNATGAQNTGNFLSATTPTVNTVNKIIVDNSAAAIATGLTLSGIVTITSDLTFINGRLKTTSTLFPTIDVSGTSTGYLLNPNNTKYVDGPMAKNTNSTSAFIFPLGNSSANKFRPFEIVPASNSAETYKAEMVNSGQPNTSSVANPPTWVCGLYYWNLSRTNTVDATVSLYYEESDLTGAPKPFDLYALVAHWDGSLWQSEGAAGLDSTSSLHKISSAAAVSAIALNKPFALGSGSVTPLPVQMLSLKGRTEGTTVILEWSTNLEINNDHFEVERSTDGITFYSVGRVEGAGNTRRISNYSFVDRSLPKRDLAYYRLKQVDMDGKASLTRNVTVRLTRSLLNDAVVFTENYGNNVKVSFSSFSQVRYTVKVVDTGGREFNSYSGIAADGTNEIDLTTSGLPGGIYFIIIESEESPLITRKIIL